LKSAETVNNYLKYKPEFDEVTPEVGVIKKVLQPSQIKASIREMSVDTDKRLELLEERIKQLEQENMLLKDENLRYKKLLESKGASSLRTSQRPFEMRDSHVTPESARKRERDISAQLMSSKTFGARDLY
jgi:hypothetical protein